MRVEQPLDQRLVADLRDRLAARMQVAALAERDQLLDDRAEILGLRQGRDDLLMLDQRAARLANIALRWLTVRFSLRPEFPWRMALLLQVGLLSC